jgi:hypothetical protein
MAAAPAEEAQTAQSAQEMLAPTHWEVKDTDSLDGSLINSIRTPPLKTPSKPKPTTQTTTPR